jgi:hypothetical protein
MHRDQQLGQSTIVDRGEVERRQRIVTLFEQFDPFHAPRVSYDSNVCS